MKELVEYIVKGLVDHPDEVAVSENRRAGDGGQRQLAGNVGY